MKNKLILFITGCFTLLLTSCLDNGNDWGANYEVDKDLQITSFSLKTDSLTSLKDVKFTIDQLNGKIMNLDSMPVGTEIEDVICTITYGSYVGKIEVLQEATGDTIDWNTEDSLNFSKPVRFILSAYDGLSQRVYDAQVNIHKMVPDSMTWAQYTDQALDKTVIEQKVITYGEDATLYYMYVHPAANSAYELYLSDMTDAKTWRAETLTGLPTTGVKLSQLTDFQGVLYLPTKEGTLYQSANGKDWTLVEKTPPIKAVLGGLRDNPTQEDAALATIVEIDGVLKFSAMNKAGEWNIGASVPTDFPVSDYASLPVSLMYRERILLAGGKTASGSLVNSAWSTMDALTWAEQTDSKGTKLFTKRQGLSMAYYDNMYYVIGGIDETGNPLKDMYRSADYGVTWEYINSLMVLPEVYQARGFASLLVDKENYLMIFGGKKTEGGEAMDDIWKGRINRLGFDRQ